MHSIRVLFLGFVIMIFNLSSTEQPSATVLVQEPHTTISGVVLDANDARIVAQQSQLRTRKLDVL